VQGNSERRQSNAQHGPIEPNNKHGQIQRTERPPPRPERDCHSDSVSHSGSNCQRCQPAAAGRSRGETNRGVVREARPAATGGTRVGANWCAPAAPRTTFGGGSIDQAPPHPDPKPP
jgi:hypothetical protein